MSKPFPNPFYEADMSKMFDVSKVFDMSKMPDMNKILKDYRMPQIDVEAAYALQRKNMEAFSALSQAAYENMQALWHRQAETMRQMMEDMMQTVQSMTSAPTPEDKALKHAEASKAAMDRYIATLRDTTETFAKCNNQALETVSARMNDSLNEVYSLVRNITDRAA